MFHKKSAVYDCYISGDVSYKPFISSEAEVIEIDLDGTEEYMVLACDGLWDAVTEEELPRLVYNFLLESNNNRHAVAKYLVQYAKDNESTDNISVIVVFFRDTLMEPVADVGFFNFLSGDSQGPKGSGENNDGSSGGDKSSTSDKKGDNSQGLQQRDDLSGGKNQERQFDHGPEQEIELEEAEDEGGPSETWDSAPYQKDSSCLRPLNLNNPEIMIDISAINAQSKEQSEYVPTESSDLGEQKEEDLDCYGVFNTRLLDGPIDLSIIEDHNSSFLLKDIADSVYNEKIPRESENNNFSKFSVEKLQDLQQVDQVIEVDNLAPSKHDKKVKKVKTEVQRSRKDPRKKGQGKSPVCWAFTGRNQASVQNHRLNMAAKTHKGSNPTPGELTLANKAPPKLPEKFPNKFAQLFSSTENVHEIANMTLSHGKLESLPPPRPKVHSNSLTNLQGFTVFGSKASVQSESQKFQTRLRPRKPLKPITSVVYETPPTPFVSNKLHWARQQ